MRRRLQNPLQRRGSRLINQRQLVQKRKPKLMKRQQRLQRLLNPVMHKLLATTLLTLFVPKEKDSPVDY